MEKLGQNNIYSQYLGNKAILRTYKGTDLINEYVPLYNPPVDWSDIRTDCPENSIALYTAHSADYSSYNNLGFTATCVGGYNVFIDGNVYGSYSSGSTCKITWSTSGITTGDDITTPTALKAHKIWIEPATSGNNITDFTGARVVSGSGHEDQGILWVHFNINTSIYFRMGESNGYRNRLTEAITAKNNLLNVSLLNLSCYYCSALTYTPVFAGPQTSINCSSSFAYCEKLQKLNFKNIKATTVANMFYYCPALLEFPKIDFSATTFANSFATDSKNLEDTILDISASTGLRLLGIYGNNTNNFISGLKGLRISNQAPFSHSSTPQINIKNTGLDRYALVQLFNDLPYNVGYEVVGSPTISSCVVSGFTTSDYTKTSLSLSSDNEKIRIKIRFKTPETFVSGNTNILTFGNSLTTNNCIRIYTGSSYSRISSFGNDINTGSPNLQTDTFYIVDVLIDGNKQYSYLYDDNNTKLAESANTTKSANFNNIGSFGGRFYSPIQAIDFNNTSIEVNDIPFFKGQPAMTKTLSCVGATGNQLSVVGSPTIVNGVVSGFSNVPNRSDVTTLDSLPSSSSLLIQVKFNTGTLKTDANQFILSTLSQTSRNICWGVAGQSKKIRIYLSSNGTTWDIANSVNGTHILADNTDYIARLTFDGSKYVVSLLIDGQWEDDITITSSLTLSKQILRFGNNETGSSYWPGSIDLNETYIKVNGETWFDINNCLLPEDRAIATNKNWTLTLN